MHRHRQYCHDDIRTYRGLGFIEEGCLRASTHLAWNTGITWSWDCCARNGKLKREPVSGRHHGIARSCVLAVNRGEGVLLVFRKAGRAMER